MKRTLIVIVFVSTLFDYGFSQNRYWEDMNESERNKILNFKAIDPIVFKYYSGTLSINSENNPKINETLRLLSENKNDSLRGLYFYIFNKQCLIAGEGPAEILGPYCIEAITSHPKLVFEYFTKQIKDNDTTLFNNYTIFIGSELYFANDGKSYSLYNYKTFKNKINESAGSFSKNEKETLELFWQRIDEIIKNMD